MLSDEIIPFILSQFALCMFILAVIFIIFHRLIRRYVPEPEVIYRWMALFSLGFTGVYAFIVHAFFPAISAQSIGWAVSPFQFEVAVADLAIGLLGIFSFNASYGFRLATVIACTVCLWGDALGHIYQMVAYQNFSVGNAGSWFWLDLLIPLILITCIIKLKPQRAY